MMMEKKSKSVRASARLMSNGEEDYWQDVFLRLPVKSLCRFRSVCKSWNCLISSPFFVNLHRSFTRSEDVYNLRSDVYFPFQFRLPAYAEEDNNFLYINLVDVVGGLVCISYTQDSTYDSTIIWNPAIHRYITLPHLPFPSHIHSPLARWTLDYPEEEDTDCVGESALFYSNVIGFGYDGVRDDFKVVRIWMNCPFVEQRIGHIPTTYEVYSTRRKKWSMAIAESIKSLVVDFSTLRSGCFVDGRIHWLVETDDYRVNRVLVFDCETEQLTTMDLPEDLYEPKAAWADPSLNPVLKAELLEYGGMVSAMVQRRWEQRTELWAMGKDKHNHYHYHWSKVFTMDNDCDVLKMYEPSFLKLAPHGVREWIKFHKYVDRFRQVFAYRETMLLVDEPQAKSYSQNQPLDIFVQ